MLEEGVGDHCHERMTMKAGPRTPQRWLPAVQCPQRQRRHRGGRRQCPGHAFPRERLPVTCGIAEHGVTSLAALGISATMAEVDDVLGATFPAIFATAGGLELPCRSLTAG